MTQFRADEGLAFMLQYENVAWYDAGEGAVLDRRIYPAKIGGLSAAKRTWRSCRPSATWSRRARGRIRRRPWAWRWPRMSAGKNRRRSSCAFCRRRTETISNARRTALQAEKLVCDGCLEAAKLALREARRSVFVREHAVNANNRRYSKVNEIARYLVPLIPDGGTVMTVLR